QFEQMQSMFGAAAPPAVVQGLADARDMLARAQASLADLKPPPPPVDPAAPKRQEAEAARPRPTTRPFAQTPPTCPAAVPPAVVQGLADARDALARAEAALQSLVGGAAALPAATPQAQASTAAPAVTAPPAEAVAPLASPAAVEASAPPVSAPAPEPPP